MYGGPIQGAKDAAKKIVEPNEGATKGQGDFWRSRTTAMLVAIGQLWREQRLAGKRAMREREREFFKRK